MAFGRKKHEGLAGGMRATALVVEASTPLDNAPPVGKIGHGMVRILIDDPSGPIYVGREFKLDEDHWLVPGMEVPVSVDPGDPQEFEVDWDAVPGIEERVAGNDPALADPRGARKRVIEALRSANIAKLDLSELPDDVANAVAGGEQAKAAAIPDRFQEALDRAAAEPASAGKQRAVVQISTTTASLVQDLDTGPSRPTSEGKRKAVLSVSVPGREPYAVFERKFKRPRKRGDVAGAGLPALVSVTDPNDVEILWDELPSIEDQVGQRIADGLAASQAEQQQLQQGMSEAIEQAIAAGPPQSLPTPGAPPAGGQLPPAMREMMAQNAKQALAMVKDPAQRKMLLDSYRAAGIEIDENE